MSFFKLHANKFAIDYIFLTYIIWYFENNVVSLRYINKEINNIMQSSLVVYFKVLVGGRTLLPTFETFRSAAEFVYMNLRPHSEVTIKRFVVEQLELPF